MGAQSRRAGEASDRVDDKLRAKIVVLYRDHGVSITNLRRRFGLPDNIDLRAILADAGVPVDLKRFHHAGSADAS